VSVQHRCAAISALQRYGTRRAGSLLTAGSVCVVLCLCSACGLEIVGSDDVADLEYGECVHGRLADSDDEDAYRLDMRSGETAFIVPSWTPDLALSLYGPDGHFIMAGTGPAEFHATQSGAHTLKIRCCGGFGPYWLYVNRASDPGPEEALLLDYGDCESAWVDSVCGVAAFAFEAEPGDTVRVRMIPLSGGLVPMFTIHGPDGTWIGGACGAELPQGESITADSLLLQSPGVYSILAGGGAWGYLGEGAGEFELCVERQPSHWKVPSFEAMGPLKPTVCRSGRGQSGPTGSSSRPER